MSATIALRSFLATSIRKRNVEILVNGQIVEQMILLKNEADIFVAQSWRVPSVSIVHRTRSKNIRPPGVIVHSEDVQQ